MASYIALCYGLGIMLAVTVFVYAMVIGYIKRRKIGNTVSFITARKQVSSWFIGWSFYAGAVGAWVIASPANYASFAGLLGLVFYSLASGLPFLMIAFFGDKIRNKLPEVLSLTDYIGWRFGNAAKAVVVAMVLFNMSIALLAEYLTIGSIFLSYVNSVSYPIIIIIGALTTIYTTYGGLLVSIYTDQIQGAASLVFFGVLAIYLAATFRPDPPLTTPMPCSPEEFLCVSGTPDCSKWDAYNAAGADIEGFVPQVCPTYGYSAIFVMPISLFSATIFSEAMWQRAWAARDKRALHRGAMYGSAMVILVVFFAGFCGLLASWAGLILYPSEDGTSMGTDPNLYLFQVLGGGKLPPSPYVFNWIGAFCVCLAVIMNEGAVDSIINGMAAAVTSTVAPMYKKWNLTMTRFVVAVLNVTLMVIAIWLTGCLGSGCGVNPVKVGVLELFLVANMLGCCGALPVLAGVFDRMHRYFGGGSFVFSILFSVFCVSVFGVNFYYNEYAVDFVDFTGRLYRAGNFSDALFYTWIGNGYSWQFFLVPVCVSLGSIILCTTGNYAWQRCMGQPAVPFFTAPATHPALYPDDEAKRLAMDGTEAPDELVKAVEDSSDDASGTPDSASLAGVPVETK